MDFYKYKLQQYSQQNNQLSLQERMQAVKDLVDDQNERKIEGVYNAAPSIFSAAISTRGIDPVSFSRVSSYAYQERMTQAVRESETIAALSAGEYFEFLMQQEGAALEAYSQEKLVNYTSTLQNRTSLINGKGIVAKVASLIGKKEDMEASLTEKLDIETEQFAVAQTSTSAWETMTGEEKTEYLLGRFEVEGLTTFDKEGFDNFGQTIALIKKQEGQESLIEEQGTEEPIIEQ